MARRDGKRIRHHWWWSTASWVANPDADVDVDAISNPCGFHAVPNECRADALSDLSNDALSYQLSHEIPYELSHECWI